MATAIAKLRKEFYNEQKMKKDIMKDVVIERKKPITLQMASTEKFKLIVDTEKLEKSIQKACVPIQKKCISVLEKPPAVVTATTVKEQPVMSICQARNLNGTPCKCKAKIGKFCAKHAP